MIRVHDDDTDVVRWSWSDESEEADQDMADKVSLKIDAQRKEVKRMTGNF